MGSKLQGLMYGTWEVSQALSESLSDPDKAIVHQLSMVLGIPQDGGSDLFSVHITPFPPASQVVHRHC